MQESWLIPALSRSPCAAQNQDNSRVDLPDANPDQGGLDHKAVVTLPRKKGDYQRMKEYSSCPHNTPDDGLETLTEGLGVLAANAGLVMTPEMGFAWFQVWLRKLCTVIIVTVYRCHHQVYLPRIASAVSLQPVKHQVSAKNKTKQKKHCCAMQNSNCQLGMKQLHVFYGDVLLTAALDHKCV
ncbi:hypothetical protein P7K49_028347 [Saguinus oedipus]|uniref:Uncharacterized protein n=1 Tax=Saguinus oedipus TaxID=9490 RepID=A0ABQ9UC10_SAGOE|nr:hypothetical protein P7K49_028347 [Saguinus oedipus]